MSETGRAGEAFFVVGSSQTAQYPCRVCRSQDTRHFLDVAMPYFKKSDERLALFECRSCGSYFYDGANPASAYTEMEPGDEFWLDYVQAGAGISSMLAPLFAIDPLPAGCLLDIGCGFGFVVDFWRSRGGRAIGLEPSSYGALGRDKLGADIRSVYLAEFIDKNEGPRFDVVFSSEVIEHTPDPNDFVEELTSAVGPDGMIVLTTPSTVAISPQVDKSTLIAALSPGFHYAIISPGILQDFFVRRGFQCRVETLGHQTIAWASRKSLPSIEPSRTAWPRYLDYLETLVDKQDVHLSTGALARLFKDALNTGDGARATLAYDRLYAAARQHYGIDLESPEIGELLAMREPLSGLRRFPSWLGGTLLFGALHVGHSRNDRRKKLRMLDAALQVLRRRAEVDFQFGQEAAHFLPFAERQYIIGLSEALTVSLNGLAKPVQNDLRHTLHHLRPVIQSFLEAQ